MARGIKGMEVGKRKRNIVPGVASFVSTLSEANTLKAIAKKAKRYLPRANGGGSKLAKILITHKNSSGSKTLKGHLNYLRYIINHPDEFTAKDVKLAETRLEEYTKKYPYLSKNPGAIDSREADDISKEWHGRDPIEDYEVEESLTFDETIPKLADLEELGIVGIEGDKVSCYTIRFKKDKPALACNLEKNTLLIVGGDQELSEVKPELANKEEVPIGFVYSIVYETDKHHLEGSNGYPELYEHFFGEEFYKGEGYNQDD